MESSKTVSNVVRVSVGEVPKVLPGVDRWKAELAKLLKAEEADRHLMQQQILFETSFSGSEGEVVSTFGGRKVVQRSIEEELRFSYANDQFLFLLVFFLAFLIQNSQFTAPRPKRSILASKRNITMTILCFESHERIIEANIK